MTGNIELNAFPIYDDRYIKAKMRTYGDKVYSNFCALIVPEDGVEYESFTIISNGHLLIYKSKYYLQLYLDKGAYK